MSELEPHPELADLLERNQSDILWAWTNRVHSIPDSHYRHRSRNEVRSWLQRGLEVMIESLRSGSPDALEDHVKDISPVRSRLGFDISEVVEAFLILKEVVVPLASKSWPDRPRHAEDAVSAMDVCLRQLIVRFTRLYAQGLLQSKELEDRQRFARDLHDSVSQSLYGVTLYAEAAVRLLEAGEVEKTAAHLKDLRRTALDALREMRVLIFELRPPVLETEGLTAALRARLAAVEGRAGVKTEFTSDKLGRLPREVEVGLHGIAQEALNNALKHSRASRISVSLRGTGSTVVLEVVDDGVGFDPAEVRRGGGLGLRGIEERATRMEAWLSVSSNPGRGTRVTVSVPVRAG